MTLECFSKIRFYVINSNDETVTERLKAQGAINHLFLSESVKFAISDDGDLGEVGEAEDLYAVPVVTSEWVRLSLTAGNFIPFAPFHPNFPKLFKNVIIVFSELSLKDRVTLSAHLNIRGGTVKSALDTSTTHLIIGKATGNLYDVCKSRTLSVKMVTPDWIVDCVKSGEFLDCAKYDVDNLIKPAPPKPLIKPKVPNVPPSSPLTNVRPSAQPDIQPHLVNLQPSISFIASSLPQVQQVVDVSTTQPARFVHSQHSGLPSISVSQSITNVSGMHQMTERSNSNSGSGKSGSKAKTSKHPSDQGLNEEQKDAIVMQNVMNILSQQPNWNKDSSGSVVPGTQPISTSSGAGCGSHLPCSFISSGSTQQTSLGNLASVTMIGTGATGTCGQRKPKSPKSPSRANTGSQSGKKSPKVATPSKNPVIAAIPTSSNQSPVAAVVDGQPQYTVVDGSQLFHPQLLVAAATGGRPRMLQQQTQPQKQQPAYLLQRQFTQEQPQVYQQQIQHQAILAATQGQFQKGRVSTGQIQMSPILLSQQKHAQPQQARAATLIVRAPPTHIEQQTEGLQQQQQGANQQQQPMVQVGVATNRIGQSLLQENQQPTYVSQQQQAQQKVLLQPGGHLIQVQGGQSAVGGGTTYQLQQKVQQQQGQQNRSNLLSSVYVQQQQQQGQPQQQQSRLSAPSAYKGQPQQGVQLQVQLQPAPQQRPNQGQRANMLRHPPQSQQQQFAAQLVAQQQQQLKVVNQQQQQIIIQTSNGAQMVAQAQDISNTQFLDGSQAQKYLGSQLRTVGPGPVAGSPRLSYSQPTVNTGGTASIVYHSAPADAALQQERAWHLQQQNFHGQQFLTTSTTPKVVSGQPHINFQQQQQQLLTQQQQQQLMQRPQQRHPGNYSTLQQQQRHMLPQQQQQPYRSPMVTQQPPPPRGPVPFVVAQRPSVPNATNNTSATPIFQFPSFHGHIGVPLPSAPDDCLVGCVMLLLGYHSHGESQRLLWRRIMRSYGAEVLDAYDPHRVTHVVVDWQLEDLDLFKQILRDKKRVVTIYWVNDVMAKGKMIPPYEILHLPSPFCPEVTFSFIRSQVISVTGFEGLERQKVELLIKQMGATFTDYLDQTNTLLVFKQPEGKKYEMASIWGIPCVNLRWLQDIYLGDLTAISADVPHKYLSFESSDVTLKLEVRTPRVQDLMVGWQTGIVLTADIWNRLTTLRNELRIEKEIEQQKELEKQMLLSDEQKAKKRTLTELTEKDIERAKSCPLRETILREERDRADAHRAEVAKATAAQIAAITPIIPTPTHSLFSGYEATSVHPPHPQVHQDRLVHPLSEQQTVLSQPTEQPFTSISSQPDVNVSTKIEDVSMVSMTALQDQHLVTVLNSDEIKKEETSSDVLTDAGIAPSRKRALSPFEAVKGKENTTVQPPPAKQRHTNSTVFKDTFDSPKSVPMSLFTLDIEKPPKRPVSLPPFETVVEDEPPQTHLMDVLIAPEVVSLTETGSDKQGQELSTSAQVDGTVPYAQVSEPAQQSLPNPPPPLDLEVRLVFTALDVDSRLACIELLRGWEWNRKPLRLVESVFEATHVIADKLIRTPKIYLAVALGRPIVTPTWLQASILREDWLSETDWLLTDPEAEENLGINLSESICRSHERAVLGLPGLFADLEFWFSPSAHHREVCEMLVKACGGRIRDRRPTQKMALMSTPRQVIICQEDEAHVATYLMRTKTGNRAVHHEEFILSGVLRQQLDFDSYQIQHVSSLYAELQAAITAATLPLGVTAAPQPQIQQQPVVPPNPHFGHMSEQHNTSHNQQLQHRAVYKQPSPSPSAHTNYRLQSPQQPQRPHQQQAQNQQGQQFMMPNGAYMGTPQPTLRLPQQQQSLGGPMQDVELLGRSTTSASPYPFDVPSQQLFAQTRTGYPNPTSQQMRPPLSLVQSHQPTNQRRVFASQQPLVVSSSNSTGFQQQQQQQQQYVQHTREQQQQQALSNCLLLVDEQKPSDNTETVVTSCNDGQVMLLQQGAVSSAYFISSGSTINLDSVSSYHLLQTSCSPSTSSISVLPESVMTEPPVTLHLPEGVSAVVLGNDPTLQAVSLNASAAVADATAVASATSRLLKQTEQLSPSISTIPAPFEASDGEEEKEEVFIEPALNTSLIIESQAIVVADVPSSTSVFDDSEGEVVLPPQFTPLIGDELEQMTTNEQQY